MKNNAMEPECTTEPVEKRADTSAPGIPLNLDDTLKWEEFISDPPGSDYIDLELLSVPPLELSARSFRSNRTSENEFSDEHSLHLLSSQNSVSSRQNDINPSFIPFTKSDSSKPANTALDPFQNTVESQLKWLESVRFPESFFAPDSERQSQLDWIQKCAQNPTRPKKIKKTILNKTPREISVTSPKGLSNWTVPTLSDERQIPATVTSQSSAVPEKVFVNTVGKTVKVIKIDDPDLKKPQEKVLKKKPERSKPPEKKENISQTKNLKRKSEPREKPWKTNQPPTSRTPPKSECVSEKYPPLKQAQSKNTALSERPSKPKLGVKGIGSQNKKKLKEDDDSDIKALLAKVQKLREQVKSDIDKNAETGAKRENPVKSIKENDNKNVEKELKGEEENLEKCMTEVLKDDTKEIKDVEKNKENNKKSEEKTKEIAEKKLGSPLRKISSNSVSEAKVRTDEPPKSATPEKKPRYDPKETRNYIRQKHAEKVEKAAQSEKKELDLLKEKKKRLETLRQTQLKVLKSCAKRKPSSGNEGKPQWVGLLDDNFQSNPPPTFLEPAKEIDVSKQLQKQSFKKQVKVSAEGTGCITFKKPKSKNIEVRETGEKPSRNQGNIDSVMKQLLAEQNILNPEKTTDLSISHGKIYIPTPKMLEDYEEMTRATDHLISPEVKLKEPELTELKDEDAKLLMTNLADQIKVLAENLEKSEILNTDNVKKRTLVSDNATQVGEEIIKPLTSEAELFFQFFSPAKKQKFGPFDVSGPSRQEARGKPNQEPSSYEPTSHKNIPHTDKKTSLYPNPGGVGHTKESSSETDCSETPKWMKDFTSSPPPLNIITTFRRKLNFCNKYQNVEQEQQSSTSIFSEGQEPALTMEDLDLKLDLPSSVTDISSREEISEKSEFITLTPDPEFKSVVASMSLSAPFQSSHAHLIIDSEKSSTADSLDKSDSYIELQGMTVDRDFAKSIFEPLEIASTKCSVLISETDKKSQESLPSRHSSTIISNIGIPSSSKSDTTISESLSTDPLKLPQSVEVLTLVSQSLPTTNNLTRNSGMDLNEMSSNDGSRRSKKNSGSFEVENIKSSSNNSGAVTEELQHVHTSIPSANSVMFSTESMHERIQGEMNRLDALNRSLDCAIDRNKSIASDNFLTKPTNRLQNEIEALSVTELLEQSFHRSEDDSIESRSLFSQHTGICLPSDQSNDVLVSQRVSKPDKPKDFSTTLLNPDSTEFDIAKFSLHMFSELIKDEELRSEHQTAVLRLREKALLDRTKAEMAWLEIQRKKFKDKGNDEQIKNIRKKQRGLLLKHQEDKEEIQRLLKAERIASRERKLLLLQQQQLVKMQLTAKQFSQKRLTEPPNKVKKVVTLSSSSSSVSESGKPSSKPVSRLSLEKHKRELEEREAALLARRKSVEAVFAWQKKIEQEERKLKEVEKLATKSTPQVLQHVLRKRIDRGTSPMQVMEDPELSSQIETNSSVPEEISSHQASPTSHSEVEVISQVSRAAEEYSDSFEQTSVVSEHLIPLSPSVHEKGPSIEEYRPRKSMVAIKIPLSPRISRTKRRHSSGSDESVLFSQNETQSEQSDMEVRVSALQQQLRQRKTELDRLKRERNKTQRERLRAKEQSLINQIQAYDTYIEQVKTEIQRELDATAVKIVKPQIKQPKVTERRKSDVWLAQEKKKEDSESSSLETVQSPRLKLLGQEHAYISEEQETEASEDTESVKTLMESSIVHGKESSSRDSTQSSDQLNLGKSKEEELKITEELGGGLENQNIPDSISGSITELQVETEIINTEVDIHENSGSEVTIATEDPLLSEASKHSEILTNVPSSESAHQQTINSCQEYSPSLEDNVSLASQVEENLSHSKSDIINQENCAQEVYTQSELNIIEEETAIESDNVSPPISYKTDFISESKEASSEYTFSNSNERDVSESISISEIENQVKKCNEISNVPQQIITIEETTEETVTVEDIVEYHGKLAQTEEEEYETTSMASNTDSIEERVVDISRNKISSENEESEIVISELSVCLQSKELIDKANEKQERIVEQITDEIVLNILHESLDLSEKLWKTNMEEYKKVTEDTPLLKALQEENEKQRNLATAQPLYRNVDSYTKYIFHLSLETAINSVLELYYKKLVHSKKDEVRQNDIWIPAAPTLESGDFNKKVGDNEGFWLGETITSHTAKEAEELRLQQLQIEQEIEELEQATQVPYFYVREIPNKPPPPYTPPKKSPPSPEEVVSRVTQAASILWDLTQQGAELLKIELPTDFLNNIKDKPYRQFMFDVAKDILLQAHPKESIQVPIWQNVKPRRQIKPLIRSKEEMMKFVDRQVRVTFGFEPKAQKENLIIRWSRKKRDHVDELLVRESQEEESEWTDFSVEESLVKNEIADYMISKVLQDAIGAIAQAFTNKFKPDVT